MTDFLNGKVILITGGTGSLGRALTKHLLEYHKPGAIRVLSRDEYKLSNMEQEFNDNRIKICKGDVCDLKRLVMAFSNVDYVIHAAAMKQVGRCERDPGEAIDTNVKGTRNVADAAFQTDVKKAVFISSDKAVAPVNLYGGTKFTAEKYFIHANVYGRPRYSVTRWGNIENSRGAAIPYFRELVKRGETVLPLTDRRMTRFLVTLDEAIATVLAALEGPPGLTWIRKSPSVYMRSIISALGCEARDIGIRGGEKLHETLVSEYECGRTYENADNMIILPQQVFDSDITYDVKWRTPRTKPYSSDDNEFLSVEQIRERLARYD